MKIYNLLICGAKWHAPENGLEIDVQVISAVQQYKTFLITGKIWELDLLRLNLRVISTLLLLVAA